MYKRIKIDNFRGIATLEIDPRQFNLFVGKNNSGKTTILETVFLLTGSTTPNLVPRINSFRTFHFVTDYSWSLIFNKLDFNSPLKLRGDLINPTETRTVTIKPLKEAAVAESAAQRSHFFPKDSHTIPADKIVGISLDTTIKKGEAKGAKKYLSQVWVIGGKIDQKTPENYIESRRGIFIFPNYGFEDNARRFNDILIKKQEGSIVKILQKLEPKIKDLTLGSENLLYCDIGFERLVPVNLIGEGINRLLSIILAIYDAANGVVLIDEVENGFHYSTLELLWHAIFESARQFNVQVFATTHSFENIKAYSSAYEKFSDQSDDMRLYRIEREDDKMKLIDFDSELLKSSLESGWEIR